MGRYILRRLLYMVAVVIVVSLITFGLMHAVPGGPFTREKALPEATLKMLNERYHLDDPMWKQYVDYLYNTMVPKFTSKAPTSSLLDDHLVNIRLGPVWLKWMNFGPSYKSRSRTVNDIFRDNLPVSAQLGVMSLARRCGDRDAAGDHGGAEAEHDVRLRGNGPGCPGSFRAGHCAGARVRMAVRRDAEVAAAHRLGLQAAVRVRLLALHPQLELRSSCDHAIRGAGSGPGSHRRPPDAREPAADRPRRLHPHGEGQRACQSRRLSPDTP